MMAFPSFGTELTIQYTVIAKSGVTPVPDSVGTFTNLGSLLSPAFLKGFNYAQVKRSIQK